MQHFRSLAAACITSALVAACGGGSPGLDVAPSSLQSHPTMAKVSPHLTGGHIYVGYDELDSTIGGTEVDVYPMGGTQSLGWIYSSGGLVDAVAFDSGGNAYVSNYFRPGRGERYGSVFETYPPEFQVEKDVSAPYNIAIDAEDNLYVANLNGKFANTVSEFAKHTANVMELISQGIAQPTAIAFDAAGNVYVANYAANDVTVYPPGSNVLSYTISEGIGEPLALLFDANGNLYVANKSLNDVTMYAPGSQTPSATISNEIFAPNALAIDTRGDIYILSSGPKGGHVGVFDPSTDGLIRKVSKGIHHPFGMAIDSSGRLYVGNYTTDVVFYAPYSNQRAGVIQGYYEPYDNGAVTVTFGP